MKDLEPRVEQQFELLEDDPQGRQRVITKIIHLCPFHRWIKEDDMIDVVVKKTGETVKRCRICEREKHENKKIRQEDWKKEKENLTDYYILRTFVSGNKHALPMNEYPKELVDAKRAVLQLKRAAKKANEPIKRCISHGDLYKEDVIKSGTTKAGSQQFKCRHCMKEAHRKHYELNKAKLKIKYAQYRKENPEKIKEIRKKYWKKIKNETREARRERWRKWRMANPEKHAKRNRKYKKQITKDLTDVYVRQVISTDSFLKAEDIPQSLIEAKRAVMMLKRGIKNKIKENKLLEMEQENGED